MPMKNDISELPKLFEAAARNDLATVKNFMEEKGCPIAIGTFGDKETAAHIAAKNGHLDVVRYMLEKSPTLVKVADAFGNTILFRAIEKGALDIVKYLIEEHKEKVFQRHRTNIECTTINTAIEFDHFDIIKYFFEEKHADVNMWNNMRETPAMTAIKFQRHHIFRYLVEERNANLTLCDVYNDNILYTTVLRNDLPSMKYVLDERKVELDINWKNEFGDTLLHRACTLDRSLGILKYLVDEKHADIHAREDGNMTALHIAAFKNNYETCQFLIEHGADVRASDNFGKTPADKASDPRLKEYMRSISASRSRRSVVLRPSYSAVQRTIASPSPTPYFHRAQLIDDSVRTGAAATSFRGSVDRAVWSNGVPSSYFQNFLACILVSVSADRRRLRGWSYQDPRIDPVAIDVIDSLRNNIN